MNEKRAKYNKTYYEKNKRKDQRVPKKVRKKIIGRGYLSEKRESRKRYRENNKEKILEYREKNKEKIAEYYKEYGKTHRDGRSDPKVILRVREAKIKRQYGISLDVISEALDKQKGCCVGCGESLVDEDSSKNYHIDHNHLTGQFRGLLCHNCNIALGHVKDDVKVLQNLIDYINRSL